MGGSSIGTAGVDTCSSGPGHSTTRCYDRAAPAQLCAHMQVSFVQLSSHVPQYLPHATYMSQTPGTIRWTVFTVEAEGVHSADRHRRYRAGGSRAPIRPSPTSSGTIFCPGATPGYRRSLATLEAVGRPDRPSPAQLRPATSQLKRNAGPT